MKLSEAFQRPIHRKIIQFFHENQASIDTPRGIATWVAEERTGVKGALEDLVRLKVLVPHRSPSTTGYSYTRETKIINQIAKFLKKP